MPAVLALREHDPERIADYRLLGRLGEGGMGVVYLARSSRGRMVAVKSIRAELAAVANFRTRFANEITVARQVGGNWTAAVLDADPHAERPWVATAYIPGPTLAEVVNQHGPLPERSVRGLASGLCGALADIHSAGLVHRDLKPSNVMITIDGPKVIDFGIVRALDDLTGSGLTSTGLVVGTPGFMAPEHIRGERLTEACDIFSLGAVLAFAACGHLAFEASGGQAHAVMYRVVHEEPDLTGVPEPLLPLIQGCLAKDPTTRPSLDTLRTREETQYRHPEPWLPAAVLARLGQDAARLLEHEDPHIRMAPGTTPAHTAPPQEAAVTEPAWPVTATVTTPDMPQRPSIPAQDDGEPRRTLAEERKLATSPEPATVAVYAALTLFTAVATSTAVQQIYLVFTLHGNDAYQYWDGGPASDLWGKSQIISGAALIVCWLIWFARARAVAEGFTPGRLRYHPSMAVLAWFIPIGNVYLPKQIANDIWHASSPPAQARITAPAATLDLWWSLWLATLVTWPEFWRTCHWNRVNHSDWADRPHGDYAFNATGWTALILRLLVIPTAIAAALYIHRLTTLQRARLGASPADFPQASP
ncbi:protein kinase [Streptomyces sp. NPDC015220]|uniref:protein kinase domain-containing protein n=1 Tax=Streptomyces sp. NPDC015220 TaxID=3364947 RepID=UPI0036F57A6B